MTRYKLLLGVTFLALEDEINRLVSDNPSAKLVNAFFAQGTGFIGAMEIEGKEEARGQAPQKPKAAEPQHKSKTRKSS